jgi:hypothetical protein
MNKIKLLVGSVLGAVGAFAGTLAAHAQSAITWEASSTDAIVQPNVAALKAGLVYVLSNVGPFLIGLAVAIAVIGLIFGLIRLYRHFHK